MLNTDKFALWIITILLLIFVAGPLFFLAAFLVMLVTEHAQSQDLLYAALIATVVGIMLVWLFWRIPGNIERHVTRKKKKTRLNPWVHYGLYLVVMTLLLSGSVVSLMAVDMLYESALPFGVAALFWLVGWCGFVLALWLGFKRIRAQLVQSDLI